MKTVKIIPVSFLFLLLCVVGSACKAQSRLLALSKSDHTLAIIDPSTLKVLTRVPVGDDPHEVIASTDGKTAYVSIYGGGSLHALNIIDIAGMKPIKTVDTRPCLAHMDWPLPKEKCTSLQKVPKPLEAIIRPQIK